MNKVFLLLVLVVLFSCKKKSKFSDVPKITYKSLQPQILQAGASKGGTTLSIYFEDGDGDIGFGMYNLFLKDSRDGTEAKMKIPEVPADYAPKRGLSGVITVDYLAALLVLRPDTNHIHSDTLRWEIYMKDKAGNISNTIYSDSLYLVK
jgi:hypothetical protein